ncbi:MAG: hypothetical protein HY287_02570 [Planctomycetes bacterium]|nr:hypothetical protein [Planctomycetota bacterium]MBI3833194.1 hypothetical protein [Planctomycetota bacterium]
MQNKRGLGRSQWVPSGQIEIGANPAKTAVFVGRTSISKNGGGGNPHRVPAGVLLLYKPQTTWQGLVIVLSGIAVCAVWRLMGRGEPRNDAWKSEA